MAYIGMSRTELPELGSMRRLREGGPGSGPQGGDKKSKQQKKYPDTAEGAIAYLKKDSTLNLTGATARPDPSVRGVWEVKTPKGVRAIVYLAGHPDPFGKLRPTNDFEAD